MKRHFFTIIELLVAIGVMMIVSSALAYTYTSTAQLASKQMALTEMNTNAVYLLDEISKDMKGIRLTDNDPSRIQMMGTFLDPVSKNLAINQANPKGTPYLTFVNAFTDLDYDKQLLDKDDINGGIYDGGVNGISEFKTSEGLKEVAYYTIFNDKSGFYDAYRAIRSPINSSLSLANDNQNILFSKRVKGVYRLSENIIYLGFTFWDGQNEISEHYNEEFPILVDVTLSMAAATGSAQWEGVIENGSGGDTLIVKKENGSFPPDSNNEKVLGFILIDNGKDQNVFQYHTVKRNEDIYTFKSDTNGKANGLVEPSFAVGDYVIIGQTFKRSFNLR